MLPLNKVGYFLSEKLLNNAKLMKLYHAKKFTDRWSPVYLATTTPLVALPAAFVVPKCDHLQKK